MASALSLCPHVAPALEDQVTGDSMLSKYKSVVSWHVHRQQAVRHTAKRRRLAAPTCGTCGLSLSRPFACLNCAYVGCWASGHAVMHLQNTRHSFCADARTGAVFCLECDDFIYDVNIDALYLSAVLTAEEKQTTFQVVKKIREVFQPWTPTAKDTKALECAIPIPCQGRRGLLNLGQTCFLNVVLQCLVHNPLLRSYFLGDKHNSKLCTKSDNCTCCEMDKLFSEIYSEDTLPFGPITLLATMWKASTELAGYAQQDAHECFISILNQIHSSSRGSTNVSCDCIIHSTFAGSLQSDVKCERCKSVTSTVDPMLDISLELKVKSGETVAGENSLAACLRRFTQPERLDHKEYSCAECGTASQSASKRLSIKKLPPVLSFQFKRFEQKNSDKTSARKIDTAIRFPASLNMAPYTTLVRREMEKDNGRTPALSYPGPETMYEYDLFAVINHEGKLNNGHYTNYARFQDEWYRFDDDKVTPSSLSACRKSAAYMCFYVKRHLDYKPFTKPSFAVTREPEASRERGMEEDKMAARMKEVEDALLATV